MQLDNSGFPVQTSAPQGDAQDATSHESMTAQLPFEWRELRTVGHHLSSRGWTRHPPPTILQSLPEDIRVSEPLQNILLWSLQRYEARIPLHPQPNEPEQTASDCVSGITEEAVVQHEAEVEDELQGVKLPKDDDSENSAHSGRSRLRVKTSLMSRLRQLRQDVASKVASKEQTHRGSASSSAPPDEGPQTGECISCFDEFSINELVHLECSHDYCKACLKEVILNAMKTESAFPPKCCLSEIPLKTVLICLEKQQREEYQEKSAEYAIPAGHRWYCPEPKCSKWIRPEKLHRDRRSDQICPHCKANICSICRSLAHDQNQDCPQDFGLESTLEVAESEGWRRCYSCRTMVELTTGCRHITCRCGAEFCYVCNARWRTCNCTEEDKERRMRDLRARREERERREREEDERQREADAAVLAEAEEIAEAIRQIEEFERQEAIRLAEEETRRQLEEELALARLEEERLLEQLARREAEEEAERQLQQILLESSKEECEAMTRCLKHIIDYQHAALMTNHELQERKRIEERDEHYQRVAEETARLESWLQENIQKRTEALRERQMQQTQELRRKAEEEEDELFMQMHMYLRDKPNREQREKRMRDAFQREQKVRQEALKAKQDKERQKLEFGVPYELEGLSKAAAFRREPVEKEFASALAQLGNEIGRDRRVFELVSQRRVAILNEHKRLVLEQLEAQVEPVGLTEDQVRDTEPILPGLDTVEEELNDTWEWSFNVKTGASNESEDLYGPSTGEPRMSATLLDIKRELGMFYDDKMSQLGRSDTVTRSTPGAYPVPATGPSSSETTTVTPTQSTARRQPAKRSPVISLISMPDVSASFSIPPTIQTEDNGEPSSSSHRISNISTGTISSINTCNSDDRRASSRTSVSLSPDADPRELNLGSMSTSPAMGHAAAAKDKEKKKLFGRGFL